MKYNKETNEVTMTTDELQNLLEQPVRAALIHVVDSWDLWTTTLPKQIAKTVLAETLSK